MISAILLAAGQSKRMIDENIETYQEYYKKDPDLFNRLIA